MVKGKIRNWLFLRGDWDANNKYNIKNDLDMWVQLFTELVDKNDKGQILFWDSEDRYVNGYLIQYKKNVQILIETVAMFKHTTDFKQITHVFTRGGHDWQNKIVRKCKNAYRIYYGAGRRYIPDSKTKYDLILVDSERQKQKVLKKFPETNVQLWIKPAANHFKPIDVKKKYDVCFVAIHPNDRRKRVKWVYKTIPKKLKMLQLGNKPNFKVPKNVKVRKITLDKMPKALSKCRVLIAPYSKKDSAPRVISEALACGVPVVCLKSVRFWKERYMNVCAINLSKSEFWHCVKSYHDIKKGYHKMIAKYYQQNLSMKHAVAHLKGLIK